MRTMLLTARFFVAASLTAVLAYTVGCCCPCGVPTDSGFALRSNLPNAADYRAELPPTAAAVAPMAR